MFHMMIFLIFILPCIVGSPVTVDTCSPCTYHHPTHRFRACKLFSLREHVDTSIRLFRHLAYDVEAYYNGPMQLETTSSTSENLSVYELVLSTHQRTQQALADITLISQWNTMGIAPVIEITARNLTSELRRILCSTGPVLRSGLFDEVRASGSGVNIPCLITSQHGTSELSDLEKIYFLVNTIIDNAAAFTTLHNGINQLLNLSHN